MGHGCHLPGPTEGIGERQESVEISSRNELTFFRIRNMARNSEPSEFQESTSSSEDPMLTQIRESLRNLKFGHVQIIVQDGVVVQIDRLERRRISRNERQSL